MSIRLDLACHPLRLWLGATVGAVLIAAATPSLRAQSRAEHLTIDDVLAATLKENPDVKSARAAVDADRGAVVQAASSFDTRPSVTITGTRVPGATSTLGTPSSLWTESSVGVSKLMRSGLGLSAQVVMARAAGPSSLADRTQATTIAGLTVPLMQARGGGIQLAIERAATLDHTASTRAHRAAASLAVFRAAVAYWEYKAAHQRAAIQRAATARSRRMVEEVQILIAADERPRSDIDLMTANAAVKQATQVESERQILHTRMMLGVAIGLDLEATAALPEPVTELPEPGETAGLQSAALTAGALARHDEIATALARKESASLLRAGALNQLQPRVDLVMGLSYTSRVGSGAALLPDVGGRGPSASAQLVFEPAGINRRYRGAAIEADAAYERATVVADALARTVRIDIADALTGVVSSGEQIVSTGEAVARARLALATVQRNFELGSATLFDRILAEDTVTNAELSDLAARLRHAQALSQLQFARGVLIETGDRDLAAVPGRLLRASGEDNR